MCDGFFDGGEGVGPGHWYVQPAGGDHLRRLHDCWRKFGRKFRVAQEKAPHGDRLEDNVQRADGHRPPAHGRKADERAAGRERRCEHARRRAANTIKRQAELSLTDSRFDPFRESTTTTSPPTASSSATSSGRRPPWTVFKPRVFANAITHRPTPELAAFCTTHSPGFKVTYSLSSSAAVGGFMASIA